MSMVKQTRHIFDIGDLLAIRLQCGHCGKEAVTSVEMTEVSRDCPFCSRPWEPQMPDGNRGDAWLLVRAMQGILKEAQSNPPCRMKIRFEIDGESDENA